MVGVPRSTSCRECRQRRVKCDRTRPECHRCQTRGITCPGYHKALKFYNHTTDQGDFTDAREFDKTRNPRKYPDASSYSALAIARARPTMDEHVVPNLVGKAVDRQLRQVWGYVVMTTFPLTFRTFAPRIEPNWVDFIRHHQAAQTAPIEKGMRCLSTWYLGVMNKDKRTIESSRAIYGDGLRCLAGLLSNPRTRGSDITLATAIMLSVFEMLDTVTPHSWLVHSRGIGQLFQLRGAHMHSTGFPRTMFITIRSFFLADAFVRQEPSFLEEPEWRTASRDSTAYERRVGTGSWIGEIVEQIFSEISLGPGFLSRTTAFITTGFVEGVSRDDLISSIQHSRDTLLTLHRQLTLKGLEVEASKGKKKASMIDDDQIIAERCLQGLCSGLALLDQLLVLLAADRKRQPGIPGNTWGQVAVPSAIVEGPFSGDDRPLDWLDQISMSMGTLAISNT
ncbi:hypothetical protein BJX99DRAFT_256615 [Aspergillus californicus]